MDFARCILNVGVEDKFEFRVGQRGSQPMICCVKGEQIDLELPRNHAEFSDCIEGLIAL